jgi:hypothetical protein
MQQLQKPKNGHKLVKPIFGKSEEIPEDWQVVTIDQLIKNKSDVKTGPFGSSLKRRFLFLVDIKSTVRKM